MPETRTATGTFDVELTPVSAGPDALAFFDRTSISKEFHGGVTGMSEGLMLSVRPDVEGSAGYVAMERVRGTVGGREGSFVLQHSGIMDRDGEGHLSLLVVPGSGTDELAGIVGSMTLEMEDGEHRYELQYSLRE